jgi:hypothetical protein
MRHVRSVLRRPLEHPEIEAIIQPPYRGSRMYGCEFHLVFGSLMVNFGINLSLDGNFIKLVNWQVKEIVKLEFLTLLKYFDFC